MSSATSAFAAVDISSYPNIHGLTSDLDVSLWVLLVGHDKCGFASMSAAEIADAATNTYKRPLSRQSVVVALGSHRSLAIVKKGSPAKYAIMKAGMDRITGQLMGVMMIDPASAFTGLQKLDAMFGNLQQEALICDPYISDATLVTLTAAPKTLPIQLLTQKVNDEAKFRQKLQAYQLEYGNLQIRRNAGKDLHDRYIVDAKGMWLVGTSLNYIGKKQTFVVALGEDFRDLVEKDFRARWAASPEWK